MLGGGDKNTQALDFWERQWTLRESFEDDSARKCETLGRACSQPDSLRVGFSSFFQRVREFQLMAIAKLQSKIIFLGGNDGNYEKRQCNAEVNF